MTADGLDPPGPPPPVTADELLERIRLQRPHLPRRLRDIADAVINAPASAATLSTTDAAKHFAVAPSALVRFAQALGFPGFGAMQKILSGGLAMTSERSYADRIEALSSGGARTDVDYIYEAFLSANGRALEAARSQIDSAALSRVVGLLRRAGLIGVVGERRAFPIATYLYYGLTQLDLPTLLVDGVGGLGGLQTRVLGRGDVLFAISFAPNAPSVVEAAQAARRAGASVVALTDRADGPVAQAAHETILVEDANLNDIRSITVSSTLVQTLFVTLGLPEGRRGTARPPRGEAGG